VTADLDRLTQELVDWLPTQRWFAGKNRPVRTVRLAAPTSLGSDPELLHTIAEVVHEDGSAARYQLLLGARDHVPENLVHAAIGGAGYYDAVHDPELTGRLLELVERQATVGTLSFAKSDGVEVRAGLRARPLNAEQSNTSLVYGQRYILKLFRRLHPGLSPDVELHRALRVIGSEHIAAPLGWITGSLDAEPTTLGLLSEFLPNAADGWAMATASVRDLMAEADLHAHEVGGDFAGESQRLGHAVASVHADLARALGVVDAAPGQMASVAAAMNARLEEAVAAVPELAEYATGLRAAFDAVAGLDGVRLQRIHGDLHLGQVLRTPTGWVLIDFEGEPAVALVRRREPASALRDVAGMLRSFDYAARHMLIDLGHGPGHGDRQHEFRALEWAQRNRDAFCDGYAEVGPDPRQHAVLLRALELAKAVYEVGYEVAHRPDWLPIPLTSIERLLAED
jgi:maltokinase